MTPCETTMQILPQVPDAFFIGPDSVFDGDRQRSFSVWSFQGAFYWNELDSDGEDCLSYAYGPFSMAREAHRDAVKTMSEKS